jgi:hypothetical protein
VKNALLLILTLYIALAHKSKRASLCSCDMLPLFLCSESYYLYANSLVHRCVTYFIIILFAAGNTINRYYEPVNRWFRLAEPPRHPSHCTVCNCVRYLQHSCNTQEVQKAIQEDFSTIRVHDCDAKERTSRRQQLWDDVNDCETSQLLDFIDMLEGL